MDRLQACVKWQNTTWQKYWPVIECLEANYFKWIGAAQGCVVNTAIKLKPLMACYNGLEGVLAVRREARMAIDHIGTPWVMIGNEAVENIGSFSLTQAICDAYNGPV